MGSVPANRSEPSPQGGGDFRNGFQASARPLDPVLRLPAPRAGDGRGAGSRGAPTARRDRAGAPVIPGKPSASCSLGSKGMAYRVVDKADAAHLQPPFHLPHRQLDALSPLGADLGVQGQLQALDHRKQVEQQVFVPVFCEGGPLLGEAPSLRLKLRLPCTGLHSGIFRRRPRRPPAVQPERRPSVPAATARNRPCLRGHPLPWLPRPGRRFLTHPRVPCCVLQSSIIPCVSFLLVGFLHPNPGCPVTNHHKTGDPFPCGFL